MKFFNFSNFFSKKFLGGELRCVCKIIDFDTCELYRPGNRAFHVLGTDQCSQQKL